jgi:hypothetical protein
MRKTGHKLDIDSLQKRWEAVRNRIKANTAEIPQAERERDARFFIRHARNAVDYTRLGYLFDVAPADLRETLKPVLHGLQIAIGMGGVVVPESAPIFLAASLALGDEPLAKWIARLPEKSYSPPDVQASPAIYGYIAALQALALVNNKKASDKVAEFRSLLIPEKMNNPKATMPRLLPIAGMLEAVTARDQAGFDSAWKEHFAYWKKNYSKASEAANYDGILDIEGLGIAVLARREGLKIPADNPYIPLEMLPPAA